MSFLNRRPSPPVSPPLHRPLGRGGSINEAISEVNREQLPAETRETASSPPHSGTPFKSERRLVVVYFSGFIAAAEETIGSKGRNAGMAAGETSPTWLEAGGTTDALYSELSGAAGRLGVVSCAG